jgi:hypothetical protein
MAMKNCFEVFGFDFLPRASGDVLVLEVNGGPALEGVAMPALCEHLVDDVLKVGSRESLFSVGALTHRQVQYLASAAGH